MNTSPTNLFAAQISRILASMSQGQWPLAEQMAGQILAADRNEPDGLQLMGIVRAQQGRAAEAEQLYRRSLALRPRQPNVTTNLAVLLAGTGRPDDAIALLRAGVRADANNMDLLMALAQVQQAAGDTVYAEKNFLAVLKRRPGDPNAVLSLSGILNMSGRPEDAEPFLNQALAAEIPVHLRAALKHNLAVSYKMRRRYGEALALFDDALADAPDLPVAAMNRASTLEHLGRRDEALAGYRDAVRRDPAHVAAHQEMNALLYRMGRDAEFLSSYDGAIPRLSDPSDMLLSKGIFLNRTGRYDEAIECFSRAARTAPDNPHVHDGMAIALAGLDRLDETVAAYEASLKLRPDVVQTQVNLAGVLLRRGDIGRALKLAQDAVAKAPTDQAGIAVYELALRLARDGRADLLTNYDKHVKIFDLEPPDGFADMATFNAALNAYLDALHGDNREHFDQTLRRGTQTMDPLFESGNELVARLRRRIEAAVADYIAQMDDGERHPLSSRRTKGFRFPGSWSSRLYDEGFHTNHIHPMGWISSCYYVEVPDAAQDKQAQQGWIKFGEPSFAVDAPVRRTVQPMPGRLVLFPSYMWHGTVPFRGPTARTTIAFDAVPD